MPTRLASTVLAALAVLSTACAGEPAAGVAEGTNRDFAHTLETPAAPEAVWALWTDLDTWPVWDTEMTEAVADGPLELGQTGTITSGGREVPFEIVAWSPPTSYAYEMPLPSGSLTVERTLEPLAGGGTRFTHDVTFRGFGGALLAPTLGRRFRRALPTVMVQLAQLAEQEAAPAE
jgi:uncharacterized protein YndB with AHSA1/START domain